MIDRDADGQLEYPRTLASLAAFVDGLLPSEQRAMIWRLGPAQLAAEATQDATLLQGISAERNAYLLFTEERSLAAAIGAIQANFDEPMIEYLRTRMQATPSPMLRARYAHTIAAHMNRQDQGAIAVNAYVTALTHYRTLEQEQPAESFHALGTLIPLAVAAGRRYRSLAQVRMALIDSLQLTNPYLRKTILEVLVTERSVTSEVLEAIREDVFRTLRDLRGAMELTDLQAMAELGIRLDSRLGRTERAAWLRALVSVYRDIIADGMRHPFVKEQAAQRCAIALQELGDSAGVAEMLAVQRAHAGLGMEYNSMTLPLDTAGTIAAHVRESVEQAYDDGGALRVLGWLGGNSSIMPTMNRARAALETLGEQGIGVFDQLATTVARAGDNRIVGHGEPGEESRERSLWQQYGCGWLYSIYVMDVATRATIATGLVTVDDLASLLEQTWIGEQDPSEPDDLVPLLVAPLRLYVGLLSGSQAADAAVAMIDSLTLRFEAVFRKLGQRVGVPVWVQRRDERGRPYTEVVGLSILDNERIVENLGEDLHAFATYTLARQHEGLRDSVAHSVTHGRDYTIATAHSLVFLLLRLALFPSVDVP